MTKRMLIDTTHAEETRVVVMDGDRVEDYDVETSSKKQLKGNIYLAKVIRVEPSLQAAFVEYGGNRHGFLAFSEIHPDYFQIPVADREKLIALQEEELAIDHRNESSEDNSHHEHQPSDESEESDNEDRRSPETVGGEHDTGEEGAASRRTARFLRNYKIQEVIRRRQVILVQVVKEERGNKGAALTTYISLAGRYCVLMPNALRGGGVSRKITSDSDRRRLRDIISELDLPRSMAMIVRTAGAGRPGPEVVRDCEYLLQLWDDIRSHALSSVAPALVYEEASLIKRAIRDLFSKDIEDITIDGESAWKSAREFMRLLMPHNANKVKLWQNRGQGLFSRYNVEGHLDAMFSPTAQLRSGGYLVINQTEALVAIDVNSGKSTAQRNIEETALRTNLEAAEEVARQLRLRDLAGLVVIDFIDMESRRHNAQVEKRLKDALRSDRARIQVGHISHFGLLEMSRQRLRPSISEAVLTPCPHCQGTGFVRGTESTALHVLRAVDEEGAKQRAAEIEVHVASGIALYILNNKRSWLAEIEQRHRMQVIFRADDNLPHSELRIERLSPQTPAPVRTPENVRAIEIIEDVAPLAAPVEIMEQDVAEPAANQFASEQTATEEENGNGRRRRRRRRRGGRRDQEQNDRAVSGEHEIASEQPEVSSNATTPEAEGETSETGLIPGRRRTRFKRAQRDTDAEEGVTVENEVVAATPEPASAPVEQNRNRRPDRYNNSNRPAQPPRQERREAPQRAYNGPTPADPFGGSFDIFDVIEQAELNQVPAPLKAAAKAVKAEQSLITSAPVVDEAIEAVVEAMVSEEAPPKPKRGRPRKVRPAEPEIAKAVEAPVSEPATVETPVEDAPAKPARRPRRSTKAAAPATTEETAPVEAVAEPVVAEATEEKPVKKTRGRRPRAAEKAKATDAADDGNVIQPINVDEAAPAKRRVGWWNR
ncbi:Rne/Rng family ribonuclease [Gluconobacter wancherniae]|uniref:Rne/Rng family ribonuclease n=1 Tax=Gluconobacter wancherniae TaxID=1307955 RepID=UPI0030A9C999